MQILKENPALAFRGEVRGILRAGLLRWDTTGRALLVSDAPRRGEAYLPECLASIATMTETPNGLLWLDLPGAAYDALKRSDYAAPGPYREGWFEVQALVAGMLSSKAGEAPPDRPMLRAAMASCALGEGPVRAFAKALRPAHAEALRTGTAASLRPCAVLLAHWLFTQKGVGLPPLRLVVGIPAESPYGAISSNSRRYMEGEYT